MTIGDPRRTGKISSSWRWANIPLPEPHMVGILASGVLHLVRPWRFPGSRQLYSGAGWPLLGAGVAISASAVRTASDVDLEHPSTLISSGAYAVSRNPMDVGCTLLYLGAALLTRNAWMVVSLPSITSYHGRGHSPRRSPRRAYAGASVRGRLRPVPEASSSIPLAAGAVDRASAVSERVIAGRRTARRRRLLR
jgi:hypothetical protein